MQVFKRHRGDRDKISLSDDTISIIMAYLVVERGVGFDYSNDRFFERYNLEGILQERICRRNGKNHGEYCRFAGEAVVLRGNYVDGKLQGLYEVRHHTGRLVSLLNYSGGLLDGEQIDYHVNGKASCVYNVIKNKLNGSKTTYFESGHQHTLTHYHQDQKHGIYVEWSEPKIRFKECMYRLGVLNGNYIEWRADGKNSVVCQFLDGNLHGKHVKFDYDTYEIIQTEYDHGVMLNRPQIFPMFKK